MPLGRNDPSAAAEPSSPPLWEDRSAHRVLETGRDHLLERSRRIVGAAYELLNEKGLEGLTVRAVLKKTGLSRRAFYERFSGKDDLVLAVFEESIRLAAHRFRQDVRRLAAPLDRLHHIVSCIVLGQISLGEETTPSRRNRRGAAMSREHLRLAESRPEDLQATLRPLIDLIAEQISDGIDRRSVRQGDPQRMATLVYNLVSTTVHTELLMWESREADAAHQAQLAADVWEFCQRALVES